jgi:hypothetical protein
LARSIATLTAAAVTPIAKPAVIARGMRLTHRTGACRDDAIGGAAG